MDADKLRALRDVVSQTLEDLAAGECTVQQAEAVVRGGEAVLGLLDLEAELERREFKLRQSS